MRAVRDAGRAFTSALRLLTVVPLPRFRRADASGALTVAVFPAVGLAVGAPLAAVALLPLPGAVRGALLLLLWSVLTGGLHEDGWADALEAALAPAPTAERIRILKDPRVGAHGLTPTVLVLLLRFAALTRVPWWALLAAPVIGRWAMAVSLTRGPSLFRQGLGARYGGSGSALGPTAIAVLALVPAAAAAGTVTGPLPGWAAAAAAGWAMHRFLLTRLGGLNGDAHGAVGLAAETVALLAYVPL